MKRILAFATFMMFAAWTAAASDVIDGALFQGALVLDDSARTVSVRELLSRDDGEEGDEEDRAAERQAAMVALFASLDGDWRGEGRRRQIENDGRRTEIGYDIELESEEGWRDLSWDARTYLRLDNGVTENGGVTFIVRDGQLYTEQGGRSEPVAILEATPTRLKYFFRRVNYYNGWVYEFTTDIELLDQDRLRIRGTVTLNDVVIAEDRSRLVRRW